jgi:hypothetical protein
MDLSVARLRNVNVIKAIMILGMRSVSICIGALRTSQDVQGLIANIAIKT